MKLELPKLTEEQKKQVRMQWQKHQHEKHDIEFALGGETDPTITFSLHPGVWNPTITSSAHATRYLYRERKFLVEGKLVLEMGAGAGLSGLVAALYGADLVVLSDISGVAVGNASENVRKLGLRGLCKVVCGDLFEFFEDDVGRELAPRGFDTIIFNHPFFPDDPVEGDTIARSMLDSGELIRRFFAQAPVCMRDGGRILMPYFTLAGDTNDPGKVCGEFGYRVVGQEELTADTGLQRGQVFVYEIKW